MVRSQPEARHLSQPPEWRKEIKRSAERDLLRLSKPDKERIRAAIERLPEGDVRQLTGLRDERRLRVGEWRVRFRIDRDRRVLVILAIKPRGGAYKP